LNGGKRKGKKGKIHRKEEKKRLQSVSQEGKEEVPEKDRVPERTWEKKKVRQSAAQKKKKEKDPPEKKKEESLRKKGGCLLQLLRGGERGGEEGGTVTIRITKRRGRLKCGVKKKGYSTSHMILTMPKKERKKKEECASLSL